MVGYLFWKQVTKVRFLHPANLDANVSQSDLWNYTQPPVLIAGSSFAPTGKT
jgi:hypothetical protein